MLHRRTPKRNTCHPLCRRKGDFFVLCVDISMPFARKSARRLENSAVLVKNSKRLADFLPNAFGCLAASCRCVGEASFASFILLSVGCLQIFRLKTWYVCVNVVFLQRMGGMAEKP